MYNKPGRYLQVIVVVLFLFTVVFLSCNTPTPDSSDNGTDIPSESGIADFAVKKIRSLQRWASR